MRLAAAYSATVTQPPPCRAGGDQQLVACGQLSEQGVQLGEGDLWERPHQAMVGPGPVSPGGAESGGVRDGVTGGHGR
jgi:hypothetical protein